MKFGTPLCCLFLAVWLAALLSNSETLTLLLTINAPIQMALFISVAAIPFLKTDRMSYVDIAWPFGVALIGAQIILMGDGHIIRRICVGGIYLLIGLRMGLGALTLAKATGVIFKKDFPRYQYARMKFDASGGSHRRFHMLAEIMVQGFANMSVLALPGFMMAINPSAEIAPWEIAGLCLWVIAYSLEMTADMQKLKFIKNPNNRNGVCNIGLWRYSRHPNYFAEWLVWTGLVIACVPSWLALQPTETLAIWIILGVGAAGASAMLYTTLVYLTGAIPAEYFSVRKRPRYEDYQRQTNRFFPWIPKG